MQIIHGIQLNRFTQSARKQKIYDPQWSVLEAALQNKHDSKLHNDEKIIR
jgi:hypothetical protein